MKFVFFKKSLNFKIKNYTSKTLHKLKLFQLTSQTKKVFKKNIWTTTNQSALVFKSFFGFLKQKPFITKVKFNFLKNFFLNPKPYTFSQIILQTKKYTSEAINNFFVNAPQPNYISKNKLKYLFFKKISTKKKKISFLLFKHKIFNYTTAKHIIFKRPKQLANQSCEFRTGLSTFIKTFRIPNTSTISTYNWKTIN